MKMELSIGILAGGNSRRMGQNKALLTLGGRTLLERLLSEFKDFDDVIVSAQYEGEYTFPGCFYVADTLHDKGPLEGICRILEVAQYEQVFLCAVDMPFVTQELAQYLAQFISSDYDCICIRDEHHLHPLCAVYSRSVLPVARRLLTEDTLRLRSLLDAVRTKTVTLEYTRFSPEMLCNLNTYEAYLAASRPWVFCVSGIKNSGKTTLIEKLVRACSAKGLRVAVIKHDGHDFAIDYAGTDTFRFTQSGAVYSGIFSKTQCALTARGHFEERDLMAFAADADILILEGLKDSDYPKIEVVRAEVSDGNCCKAPLICTATNLPDLWQREDCVDLNDINAIFQRIHTYFTGQEESTWQS